MKRIVFVLVIISLGINAYSQTINERILISVQGDFTKTLMNIGATKNNNELDGKYLDIGASMGFITKNGFTFGFGIDYKWAYEEQQSALAINRFFQAEMLKSKSTALIPNVYLGYYYRIINEFFFNANLKIGYGVIRSEFETIAYNGAFLEDQYSPINKWDMGYVNTNQGSDRYDYFSAGIYPQLNYFIKKHWGLCLSLGGIEYAISNWQNSSWIASFKPSYWNFGIKLKF